MESCARYATISLALQLLQHLGRRRESEAVPVVAPGDRVEAVGSEERRGEERRGEEKEWVERKGGEERSGGVERRRDGMPSTW